MLLGSTILMAILSLAPVQSQPTMDAPASQPVPEVSATVASLPAVSAIQADLLPQPRQIEASEGAFQLAPATIKFLLTGDSPESTERLAKRLWECIFRAGLQTDPSTITKAVGESFSLVAGSGPLLAPTAVELPAEAREQGYQLVVNNDAITISAAGERGLFYGFTTFEQILNRCLVRNQMQVPGLKIMDSPALAMRGYSEDYGRNQLPTVADHQRSIRFLAQYKMNTYFWFIEPDHFVYQFDPEIGKGVDRFTFEETKTLSEYARQYHIDVIPTLELLGHMESLLADPKYRDLAEVPGGPDLCPVCNESFELVRKIVGEVVQGFSSPYVHCGLDESFTIGQGRSAEAVKAKGIERVLADYYIRLNDLLKSHGKTMIMYPDIVLKYPGIIELLPRDIVMMFWDYMVRERYEDMDKLTKAGFKVMALSGLWDWNNLYPIYPRAFRNMEILATQAAQTGALGHFVSSWGDPHRGVAGFNLSEWNTFGVAACGAVSWNPAQQLSIRDFARPFALTYYGLDNPELAEGLTLLAECQNDRPNAARAMFACEPLAIAPELAKISREDLAFWRKLRDDARTANRMLENIRPPRNADYLRSVNLSARMLQFSGELAVLCNSLGRQMDNDLDASYFADQFEDLAERYQHLAQEYQATYAATNRPLNLEEIGKQFTWMHQQLITAAETLRAKVEK